MNRHSICSVVVALACASAAYADDLSQQMIEAPHVEKYFFVTLNEQNGDSFYFAVDTPGAVIESKPLKSGMTVTAASGDGGGFNVIIGYLNPIEYSWSLSESASEEPTYASAKKFAEALNGLLATVSPETAKSAESRLAAYNMMTAVRSKTHVAVPVLSNPELYSSDLVEWLLWSGEKSACFDVSNNDRKAALDAFLTAVTAADDNLFGTGAYATATVRGHAVSAISALKGATSVNDLSTQALSASRNKAGVIKTANDQARAAVGRIESTIDNVKFTNANGCSNFERYTKASMARFITTAKRILAEREQLHTDLEALNNGLAAQLVNAGTGSGDNYFRVGTVLVTNEQMKEVTLIIRRRILTLPDGKDAIQIEDKGELTTTLRVRPHQPVVLEFAPGVVYTNLSYPRFGTATVDGRTVVAEGGRARQNVSLVAMLNIIPNVKVFDSKALSWLVAQVGLGTAEKYPMLLAGAGIRLPSVKLALTAGAAWSWVQTLEDLRVGDEISGTADLERDLTYRFQSAPAFYLGIQRGF